MTTNEFTPQQLRDLADAREAERRGENIEWYSGGRWLLLRIQAGELPLWSDGTLYRPAPIPTPRYWSEPAHVPGPVCWIRKTKNGWSSMIVGCYMNGIRIVTSALDEIEFTDIRGYEHSIDRLNWKPCLLP